MPKLHTGQDMPSVGLGTWQAPPGEVGNAVRIALEVGYRHIDCAAVYGNEPEVGEAMEGFFKTGAAKREDVFVTSKLWNSEHQPEDVEPALRKTLEDLKLEYLDLYLIHWPQAFKKVEGKHFGFPRTEDGKGMLYNTDVPVETTWAALEKCVDLGLVKAIGLSNFNSEQVKRIHGAARIKPAVLQCESHPFFTNEKLFALVRGLGMVATAYSPLGTGAEIEGVTVPKHPLLAEIGKRHDKSAAQVALALQLRLGNVVLPKSVSKERIAQNFDVNFELTEEDMKALSALDKGLRQGWGGPKVERGGEMRPRDEAHPDYPFKAGIEF